MEAAATVVKQDEHVVQCVTHSHSNSSDTQSDMLTNSDCRRHSCDAVSPSTSTVLAVASSSQCSVNSDVSDVTDVTPTDLSSSPDVQIMRELNEMKAILQRLLYDKEVCVNDTGSSVNRVTSVTSANMLHELLVESTFSDNDLTLLACMRHLYPLSGMYALDHHTYLSCGSGGERERERFQGDPLGNLCPDTLLPPLLSARAVAKQDSRRLLSLSLFSSTPEIWFSHQIHCVHTIQGLQ